MNFKLTDGAVKWATHYKDGEYFYEGDDIPDDAEEVEQPSQEIKDRAEKLKGKTFSKTQFQRMLENPTPEERIEALEKASGAGGQAGERGIAQRIDKLEDDIAEIKEELNKD